jgi:hypothetical protein
MLLLTHHVFQPLTEILFPLVLLPGGCLCFQSIPTLSKPALSNGFLRNPSWNGNHPDTSLLTCLSIPICGHSFQTRIVLLLTVYEFFIPILYCYKMGIPERLLLTPHSFLTITESVRNLLLLTWSSSPHREMWRFPSVIANTAFVSVSDYSINRVQPLLLLTWLFTTNPSKLCSRLLLIRVCVPILWLGHPINYR